MTKSLIISIILFLKATAIVACCAEKDYRLFPIGELNQKIVFIEFDLFRNCKMRAGGKPKHEFWTKGSVRLVQNSGDSLIMIEKVDSIDITECQCTYKEFYQKTKYESKLVGSYMKALKIAKQKIGFQLAQPKAIVFNDSINTKVIEETSNGTYSHTLQYKDLINLDLESEGLISCYPNKVAEVRTYETGNFKIIILRLRCSFLDERAILRNTKRFYKIETGFWKEQAQWHGKAKDYWIIKNNKL